MSKFLVRVGYAALVVAIVGVGSVEASGRGDRDPKEIQRARLTQQIDALQARLEGSSQYEQNSLNSMLRNGTNYTLNQGVTQSREAQQQLVRQINALIEQRGRI